MGLLDGATCKLHSDTFKTELLYSVKIHTRANFLHSRYDTLERMGIADGRGFMAASFPSGLVLESAFVSPNIVNQLEAAVDDVISSKSWLDALSILPSSLEAADITALLQRIPALQIAGAYCLNASALCRSEPEE